MTKEATIPVVAQSGTSVGLALLPAKWPNTVGSTFVREPEYGIGKWTIIKRFDEVAEREIKSLITLIGFEKAQRLFKLKVLNPASAT